ncbi:MAG TPA: chemotaxis signal transduction protein CheV, partial [Candidatus Tenderia electrophaga]|nr:chemotaxis signal transduction protein CheV [Candidatus Tenderia electrophaga]
MNSSFITSVDERTKLAGANRLEILLFSLGHDTNTHREEVFGLNVFKIREVIQVPEITHAPDMPVGVKGLVSLRGVMIPVIDMAHFCGMSIESPPTKLIVTEYNKTTQGLLVNSVEQILRLEWNDIKVPPSMMANRLGGLITAVTELNDKRIVMLLDVEKVLAETAGTQDDPSMFEGIERLDESATIFFADDSSVARRQIENTLERLGANYYSAKNGEEAWEKLQEIAARAEASHTPLTEMLQAIITDVEMPGMDGYVLTKYIKSDARFKGIPVLMHSSLSADAN